MTRAAAHIGLGFVILIVVGAGWSALFGEVRVMPNAVAVIALYLGLTWRGRLAPAMAAAAGIGYLADVLAGTPAGLLTLVACLICAAAHVVQGRLVIRGKIAAIAASAAAALVAGLLVVGLARLGAVSQAPLPVDLVLLVEIAAVTALFGPLILTLHRRLDSRLLRTRRERDELLEGVVAR